MPTILQLLPLPQMADLPSDVRTTRLRPPPGTTSMETGRIGHGYTQTGNRVTFLAHEPADLAFLAALETDACDCVTAYRNLTAPTQSVDTFYRLPNALSQYWLRLIGDTARVFLARQGITVEPVLARRAPVIALTSGLMPEIWRRPRRHSLATFSPFRWDLSDLWIVAPKVVRHISRVPCHLCAPKPGERSHGESPRHRDTCQALFRQIHTLPYPRFTVVE